jgi:sugar (pentulose or hexulose) kinase
MDLQLGNTRADMARAIMESAAFEVRWALSTIQQANLPVDKLWMVGGAAQSPHWPAILADVLGIPIDVPQYDNWPALGAAILAGVGLGLFENIEDGQERFQKSAQHVAPDESLQSFYDASFMTYKRFAQDVER